MSEVNVKISTWVQDEVFPSIYGRGTELVEELLKVMEAKSWPSKDIFAVQMALVESITNAIDHGNHCNPEKNVTVRCSVSDSLVRVSVKDEGPGFNEKAVPDPRNKENIDIPSGRGVLLIHGFMTKVWFNDSGNEVFMEKVRSTEV